MTSAHLPSTKPTPSPKPLTLLELHNRLRSFDTQTRVVAAGELALVAIIFSDLTSHITGSIDCSRWLIGVCVTAVLLAGASTAFTWIYTHDALNNLDGPAQPLSQVDASRIRNQYKAARLFGWVSICLALAAGATFLLTVWLWTTRVLECPTPL